MEKVSRVPKATRGRKAPLMEPRDSRDYREPREVRVQLERRAYRV